MLGPSFMAGEGIRVSEMNVGDDLSCRLFPSIWMGYGPDRYQGDPDFEDGNEHLLVNIKE